MSDASVTVLMPVYNAVDTLEAAVSSILGQSRGDLELWAIDDGSTDASLSVLRQFNDSRLRILENSENQGVTATLNRGLDEIRSRYVVRMDADDIAVPDRIEQQVGFMEQRPDLAVSGSAVSLFGDYTAAIHRYPVGAATVRYSLMYANPVCHPSAIIRRDVLAGEGLRYDPVFSRCEDYDLWSRVSACGALDNLDMPLLKFRVHGGSVTGSHRDVMMAQTREIIRRELERHGLDMSQPEVDDQMLIGSGQPAASLDGFERCVRLVERLGAQGVRAEDPVGWQGALDFHALRFFRNNAVHGCGVWTRIPAAYRARMSGRMKAIMFAAMLRHTVLPGGRGR